jgi:hypothetical protein
MPDDAPRAPLVMETVNLGRLGNRQLVARRQYLGDGAYVQVWDGQIVFTAENGIAATDAVVLDESMARLLLTWLAGLGLRAR